MRFVAALFIAVLSVVLVAGEDPSAPAPRTKEYGWMSVKTWTGKHDSFVKRAKEGKVDLLFLGDSITEGWGNNAVWQKHYALRHAANFGIGGDVTQNVLWRITSGGEIEGLSPKAVVLMIGTNNFGLHGDTEAGVVKGITTLVTTLRTKLPGAKILLLGIFPRDQKPETGFRKKIKAVNEQIAKLDDGKAVRFLDISSKFLADDGTMSKDIAPDFLHLSVKGYEIWADAMNPLLAELMK